MFFLPFYSFTFLPLEIAPVPSDSIASPRILKVKKQKKYIMTTFQDKVKALRAHHEELLSRKNEPLEWGNGIYEKYKNPILTA